MVRLLNYEIKPKRNIFDMIIGLGFLLTLMITIDYVIQIKIPIETASIYTILTFNIIGFWMVWKYFKWCIGIYTIIPEEQIKNKYGERDFGMKKSLNETKVQNKHA